MGDCIFRKASYGTTPDVEYATADEALEEGDLVNFDGDGEMEKLDDAADEVDIALVLADADADDTDVPYVWLGPDVLIEGAMGTLGKVGELVAVDVTSNVITFTAAPAGGPARFIIRKIVDSTNKKVLVSRIYDAYVT